MKKLFNVKFLLPSTSFFFSSLSFDKYDYIIVLCKQDKITLSRERKRRFPWNTTNTRRMCCCIVAGGMKSFVIIDYDYIGVLILFTKTLILWVGLLGILYSVVWIIRSLQYMYVFIKWKENYFLTWTSTILNNNASTKNIFSKNSLTLQLFDVPSTLMKWFLKKQHSLYRKNFQKF